MSERKDADKDTFRVLWVGVCPECGAEMTMASDNACAGYHKTFADKCFNCENVIIMATQ